MENQKCVWSEKCRNGCDGCWTLEPENCVRYMPLEGTNFTKINGIMETPPDINWDKFTQYFMNWVECMGWTFTGGFEGGGEDFEIRGKINGD